MGQRTKETTATRDSFVRVSRCLREEDARLGLTARSCLELECTVTLQRTVERIRVAPAPNTLRAERTARPEIEREIGAPWNDRSCGWGVRRAGIAALAEVAGTETGESRRALEQNVIWTNGERPNTHRDDTGRRVCRSYSRGSRARRDSASRTPATQLASDEQCTRETPCARYFCRTGNLRTRSVPTGPRNASHIAVVRGRTHILPGDRDPAGAVQDRNVLQPESSSGRRAGDGARLVHDAHLIGTRRMPHPKRRNASERAFVRVRRPPLDTWLRLSLTWRGGASRLAASGEKSDAEQPDHGMHVVPSPPAIMRTCSTLKGRPVNSETNP